MCATAAMSAFTEELLLGHGLALECGNQALRFLDRAKAAKPGELDLRANLEALRMAGLASRLMEGVRRLVTVQATQLSAPPRAATAALAAQPAPRYRALPGQRRGALKNGNPSGDYLSAPRCGARTRAGCACRQPAMANGRCRLHGGRSTGPRTAAGLARSRAARLSHGYRTAALIGLRSRATHAARRLRALSAGHGVHRPVFKSVGARCVRPSSTPITPSSAGVGLQDPRARATRPDAAPSNGSLSAGHGVHRSFRDRLRGSAVVFG